MVLLGGMVLLLAHPALRAPIMVAAVTGAALLHTAHLRRQLKDERAWGPQYRSRRGPPVWPQA